MDTIAVRKLDDKIAELAARLERLKALRSAIGDASIAADIADLFGAQEAHGKARGRPRGRRSRESTAMAKVRAVFNANQNAKMTLRELAEKSALSWHTVRQLIYTTRPEAFEREKNADGGRKSTVRLMATKNPETH